MNISEYLNQDHVRLHGFLGQAVAGPEIDLEAFERFRSGLLRHIAIEEKILLREVRIRLGDAPHPAAHRLRVEHGALTSLMVPTPDRALIDEIRSLLDTHDKREEGPEGVYASCADILGAEAAEELGERAASYPEIRVMPHYDGPNVFRTAADALASAEKMAPPRPGNLR